MSVLKKFNPYDSTDDLVEGIATGREEIVADIVETVVANLTAPVPQHLLVVAPRGFGKSFLIRLIQVELERRMKDGLPVVMAILPEEQPNVTAPHLLLEEICRLLEKRPPGDVMAGWFDDDAEAWGRSIERLHNAVAERFGGRRGLVVATVENFDHLMATVFRDDEDASRLRKLMAQRDGPLMLLATATSRVDADYGARLFHAFRTIDLRPWEEGQCLSFFRKASAHIGQTGAGEPQISKARAVAQFIGGSPRMATMMYDVLQTHDSVQAASVLDALIDELTPYYKHRLESLSPRARVLVDTLLRMGEPRSQSEVADSIGTAQNRIAQPFSELLAQQIVTGTRAIGSRETLYRVTDRVMAHYYRKRMLTGGSAISPLEGIVDFLEVFFTGEEKEAEAMRLRGLGLEQEAVVLDRLAQKSRQIQLDLTLNELYDNVMQFLRRSIAKSESFKKCVQDFSIKYEIISEIGEANFSGYESLSQFISKKYGPGNDLSQARHWWMVMYFYLSILVRQSWNSSLIRRLSADLAGLLPTETGIERALLDAVALYIDGGCTDSALERVDPDIASAVKTIRISLQ